MTNDKALQSLKQLNSDKNIKNLIEQAYSRNILFESNEPLENFPKYTKNLDEKINYIAFSYLSIACILKEKKSHFKESSDAFEKSGNILYLIHAPKRNKKHNSNFYLLISSLSFYIASQYSKSFIAINKAESSSKFINLISTFLKKDMDNLILKINEIILNNEFKEKKSFH